MPPVTPRPVLASPRGLSAHPHGAGAGVSATTIVVLLGCATLLLATAIYLAGSGAFVWAIAAAVLGLVPAGELAVQLLRVMVPDQLSGDAGPDGESEAVNE